MSTTGRDLRRRLWLLLTLGALTTFALFGAYRGVHDDTVPLSSSSAPGILAVDTARNAMEEAHEAVKGGEIGDFNTQISVAYQNIAVAASENIAGPEGRHKLQTITGLIAVYSGLVQRSGQEPALRDVYLYYAERVLKGEEGSEAAIVSRLDDLRADQVEVAERQASFPWSLWLAWSAVLVLCLVLCVALVEAQVFARRRFRSAVNPPLLAATLLCAAGVAALGWFTLRAQIAMAGSFGQLRSPSDAEDIPRVAEHVREHMANADFWAALSNWVLVGGAVLMALTVMGMWPRISEYRFRESR
jgi:hypothetical protein